MTDEWDAAYPDHAERWKRTSYHDDLVLPEGYEELDGDQGGHRSDDPDTSGDHEDNGQDGED